MAPEGPFQSSNAGLGGIWTHLGTGRYLNTDLKLKLCRRAREPVLAAYCWIHWLSFHMRMNWFQSRTYVGEMKRRLALIAFRARTEFRVVVRDCSLLSGESRLHEVDGVGHPALRRRPVRRSWQTPAAECQTGLTSALSERGLLAASRRLPLHCLAPLHSTSSLHTSSRPGAAHAHCGTRSRAQRGPAR